MLGVPGETDCHGVQFPVHGGWNSIDNGAHGTEKLLLKTHVSGDLHGEVTLII